MADVTVKGMDDLIRSLKQFPQNVQKNVMTGAVRAAASAIAKEARIQAPKDTEQLAKSIAVVKRKESNPKIISFTVAPRLKKKHGYLAHMHEFGTSKMAAHPFMRPAFEKKGAEAITIVKVYMEKRIGKEIEKAAKK